jgi:hypothetical protein
MVDAVNGAGGGQIIFGLGRTYFVDRFVTASNGISDLTFAGCDGLSIDGNGATLSVKGDFHRDAKATRGLSGLLFEDCRNVSVRNIFLDGNVHRMTRLADLPEAPTHGLHFQSCLDVHVDRIEARRFAADGMYVRESKRTDRLGYRTASRRFTVRNSRFLFNARQGLSVIQLRGGLFESCEFSHTGYIDRGGRSGPYGAHSPGAGVDIEPNRTPFDRDPVDVLTGDLLFRGCSLVGNAGASLVAAKYAAGTPFIEQVTLETCQFECNDGVTGGQDGFIFDVRAGLVQNCTLGMRDKTAYLGWYPDNGADQRFAGNVVYGRNPRRNRPIFAVRRTRGSPVIEANRFVGQQQAPKDPRGAWLVFIDNPNAVVRRNSVFVPAAAFPVGGGSKSVPFVFARARLMDGNTYESDFVGGSRFAVVYGEGTRTRNEIHRGHVSGPPGALRSERRPGD